MEEVKPRLPQGIKGPSTKMRQEHDATGHAVFRPWSLHCIAGKGLRNPHVDAGESEESEVVFEYGFDTEEKEKCAPMIICRETRYGSYAASKLANKGVNAYTLGSKEWE